MSFKDNINRICLERGTNLTSIVKQVKGSSSFTSSINKGSLPKEDEMVKMAKLLNCSVIDFSWTKKTSSNRWNRKTRTKLIFSGFIVHCRDGQNMSSWLWSMNLKTGKN